MNRENKCLANNQFWIGQICRNAEKNTWVENEQKTTEQKKRQQREHNRTEQHKMLNVESCGQESVMF